LLRDVGMTAGLTVPITAAGRHLGALSLISAESGRRFSATDVELAEELARRAGTAIENARLYTERSHIARTLQVGLLPGRIPRIAGWEIGTLYRPAGDENWVGGDFYDVFGVRGGWMALVGDVADERHPAAAHSEDVVEVAADPVLVAGRPVQRADLPARDPRDPSGQQSDLQRARDVRALRVEARVLDRGAGAARELLGELDVGRGEAPPRLGADQAQRTEVAAGRGDRHGQPGCHPHVAQQLEVLVVLGRRDEQVVADLVDDLRDAVADRCGDARRRVGARRVALADPPRERDVAVVDAGRLGDAPSLLAASSAKRSRSRPTRARPPATAYASNPAAATTPMRYT